MTLTQTISTLKSTISASVNAPVEVAILDQPLSEMRTAAECFPEAEEVDLWQMSDKSWCLQIRFKNNLTFAIHSPKPF